MVSFPPSKYRRGYDIPAIPVRRRSRNADPYQLLSRGNQFINTSSLAVSPILWAALSAFLRWQFSSEVLRTIWIGYQVSAAIGIPGKHTQANKCGLIVDTKLH